MLGESTESGRGEGLAARLEDNPCIRLVLSSFVPSLVLTSQYLSITFRAQKTRNCRSSSRYYTTEHPDKRRLQRPCHYMFTTEGV
jgi:hypothetical protein